MGQPEPFGNGMTTLRKAFVERGQAILRLSIDVMGKEKLMARRILRMALSAGRVFLAADEDMDEIDYDPVGESLG